MHIRCQRAGISVLPVQDDGDAIRHWLSSRTRMRGADEEVV
jgi:hypothetical protein